MVYSLAIYNLSKGLCFWGFIDRILNVIYQFMLDQQEFYFGYKQKNSYKYLSIVILNNLVSSLIRLFIGQDRDWKMMELLGLENELCKINLGR